MLYHPKSGFTLIELSIVLVIIGLIIGGVLVGQDLIRAAEVRATISQIEKYQTAVNTFREKYGAVPGDLNALVATQFGFTARGNYAGQGDGNGILQGVDANLAGHNYGNVQNCGESAMFWVDLTTANGMNINMIEGSFSTASPTTPPGNISGTFLTGYFPQAKIGRGNYIYVYSNSSVLTPATNYFGISALSQVGTVTAVNSTPAITVKQAYDIDKKVDDGYPTSGRVVAYYLNTTGIWGAEGGVANLYGSAGPVSASSQTCYDDGGNSAAPMLYSLTQANGAYANCALSFGFQ